MCGEAFHIGDPILTCQVAFFYRTERQIERAVPTHARLFSEERPNLHKNRFAEIERCMKSLKVCKPCLTDVAAKHAHRIHLTADRTLRVLQRVGTDATEAETQLLIAQVLAAGHLVKSDATQRKITDSKGDSFAETLNKLNDYSGREEPQLNGQKEQAQTNGSAVRATCIESSRPHSIA